MSFWSPSSASAAKIPVSAEPGFVKRYSTPASLRVWISNIPPVPVIVLRMVYLALWGSLDASRASATELYQGATRARPRGGEVDTPSRYWMNLGQPLVRNL